MIGKAVVVAAVAAAVSAANATAAYRVTELKPLRGTVSFVFDVNLARQATGVMTDDSGAGTVFRGFFYGPKTGLVDIGDLGGRNTFARAINEAGVVTGSSQTAAGASHAFVYTPGVGMRDLGSGPAPQSFGNDISESGSVIGDLVPGGHSFLWSQQGGLRDLGAASMEAFNAQGDVFGYVTGPGTLTPGMWAPPYTTFVPFGPLPARFIAGQAFDGNVFGEAVGALVSDVATQAAFYWDGRTFRNITPVGVPNALGEGINDAGSIVIHGFDAFGLDVPYFKRTPAADAVRGDEINPAGSPFSSFVEFTSINNRGMIGGAGRVGAEVHGVILTPAVTDQVATVAQVVCHGGASVFCRWVRSISRSSPSTTRCFELARFIETLRWFKGPAEVVRATAAAIRSDLACRGLPAVPLVAPHVFARKGEREQVAVRARRAVTIRVEFPAGSRFDVTNVRGRKARTKTSVRVRVPKPKNGTLRFGVVAKRLLKGNPTPVTTRVS